MIAHLPWTVWHELVPAREFASDAVSRELWRLSLNDALLLLLSHRPPRTLKGPDLLRAEGIRSSPDWWARELRAAQLILEQTLESDRLLEGCEGYRSTPAPSGRCHVTGPL